MDLCAGGSHPGSARTKRRRRMRCWAIAKLRSAMPLPHKRHENSYTTTAEQVAPPPGLSLECPAEEEAVTHATCDGCGDGLPIAGREMKCIDCEDFDLCQHCYDGHRCLFEAKEFLTRTDDVWQPMAEDHREPEENCTKTKDVQETPWNETQDHDSGSHETPESSDEECYESPGLSNNLLEIVFNIVDQGPTKPSQLMDMAEEWAEDDVRDAVWQWLELGALKFTNGMMQVA